MPRNTYRLASGEIVPGVTTICNIMGKGEPLMDWVAKVTKEGKDWRQERDSAGDTGTIVHEVIMNFLTGEELPSYSDPVVDKCFDKFKKWWKSQPVSSMLVEKPLVSERYGFGGQFDLYIEDEKKIVDIKTSNGIYDSYWIQLAGYDILLKEHGYKVDEYQILWLPKDDRFDCPIRTDLRKEKQVFRHLLAIWKLRH